MTTWDNAGVQVAIEALESEEKLMVNQIASLQNKLAQLRAAMAPLRQLLGNAAKSGDTVMDAINQVANSQYRDLALPDAIASVLALNEEPMGASEIATKVREGGYTTSSQDFPNVVGTTLRRLKNERFHQQGDGRWALLSGQR